MKRFLLCLLSAAILLASTACSGSGGKDVDVSALASALEKNVTYDSTLTELSAERLGNFIDLPDGAEAAAYMSDGSTTEEIIVVRCASDADAAAVKAEIEALLGDQKYDAQRYNPEEAARAEKAVFEQRGTCIVLCISADSDAAARIVKEHLG